MNAIDIQGVYKRFGRQPVLHELSLAVEPGEYFALVGGNGAGKSTLIRLILDFMKLDAGTIRLFGRSSLDPSSRDVVAFLPERFTPPAWINGEGYLRAFLKLYGTNWKRSNVEEMCDSLFFDPAQLRKPVTALSKGMTQKIGLMAVFLSGKPLLILDEPMSGLDPLARIGVKRILKRLRRQGTTLFYSSHMLPDVEAQCDRLAILHQRRFRFTGTVGECLEKTGTDDLEEAYLRIVMEEPERESSRSSPS